ncbi:MAG: hypothetical protein O7C75_07510 [Verrucomicrobia bacterium]|nr:hypothetical protein [Verrucomicrobiota bacterium]
MRSPIPTPIIIALVCSLPHLLMADNFVINGKTLIVPTPPGFAKVTEKMEATFQYFQLLEDPVNDKLADYISEADVPAAMAGEIPSLD